MDPQESFWARPATESPAPESTPPSVPPPVTAPPATTPPATTPPGQQSGERRPYDQGPDGVTSTGPWGQVWDNRVPAPPGPPRRPPNQFLPPSVRPDPSPPARQSVRYVQPAAPGGPPPTRPRRHGTVALVTVVVAGLLVLAVGGTVVGMLIGTSLPEARRPRALPPQPTVAGSTSESTPTPPPTPTPTPTPTPSSLPSPTASTSSTSGREVYADLPQVIANGVYDLETQTLECRGLGLPVPEDKRLEPWAKRAVRCLHDHYSPVVEEAGYTLTRPAVTFYNDSIDTPCGDGASGAFYCALDEGIYVQRGVYVRDAGRLNTIRMLLHEFSHHVQNRVGILGDDKYGREPVPVISRRVELQASCWTGMQLRGSQWLGWKASDEQWLRRFNSVDSDKMHGRAESRRYWYEQGRTGSTFGVCNTWVADRHDVG